MATSTRPHTARLEAVEVSLLRGGRLLLAGVSWRLSAGEALILRGPNGTGKTSLLRLLAGLIKPLSGHVLWDGVSVFDDPEGFRSTLAFLGPTDGVKPTETVAQTVTFWAAQADPRQARTRADLALDRLGITHLADTAGRYLSSGQRRRLALARVLATPARLWLLDEPTVGLDADGIGRLEAMVADHVVGGGLALISTHQPIQAPGAATLNLSQFVPTQPILGFDA